jgi:hypothetical protein
MEQKEYKRVEGGTQLVQKYMWERVDDKAREMGME